MVLTEPSFMANDEYRSNTGMGYHALFHPMRRHLFRGFRWFDIAIFHPDIAGDNLNRPIRSKIVWNNSLGTATSAI